MPFNTKYIYTIYLSTTNYEYQLNKYTKRVHIDQSQMIEYVCRSAHTDLFAIRTINEMKNGQGDKTHVILYHNNNHESTILRRKKQN